MTKEELFGALMCYTEKMGVCILREIQAMDHTLKKYRETWRYVSQSASIGAYRPRWFMKFSHMNPAESLLAHRDLNSLNSIGIHFGTFKLTKEGIDDPVRELESEKEKLNLILIGFMS